MALKKDAVDHDKPWQNFNVSTIQTHKMEFYGENYQAFGR